MDPTASVDDTLRRWPRLVMASSFTWWHDEVVRCHTAARGLLRSACAAVRARQARALREQKLQDLDDRMLRDIGIDPSTVPRTVRVELMPLLFAQWSR